MTGAEQLAQRIATMLPHLESRAIRFWGQWVGGKAWDNWYRLTRCTAEDDRLQMGFDTGEALFLWAPSRAVVDQTAFRIGSAERLRWEWFAEGASIPLANCHFFEFVRTTDSVEWTRDAGDWRMLHPVASEPAVELLSAADLRRSF